MGMLVAVDTVQNSHSALIAPRGLDLGIKLVLTSFVPVTFAEGLFNMIYVISSSQ